jgi:hypothetical protein
LLGCLHIKPSIIIWGFWWRHWIFAVNCMELTTQWRFVLEKLIVARLFNSSPFLGTRKFTGACHWPLSWATPSHPITLNIQHNSLLPSTDVFHVVPALQVFRPAFCMRVSSLPCVLHASPTSSSWIWSS